jgi:SAM-dependent methyltransferase
VLQVDRGDVALWRCPQCAFVSGYPAGVQSSEQRYAHYYSKSEPPPPIARYAEWLGDIESVTGRGRLLEVGAGSGALVRTAIARGWSVDATEVSASGLARLRESGARVHEGDLTSAAHPPGAFDAIVSLEVLEHVPQPAVLLEEMARVLRAGGVLLLTTPNLTGLTGLYFKERWRVVHPEHLGYFTPATLRRALSRAGFGKVRVRTRSLDVTSWHGTRNEAAAFDPHAAARLRDRVQQSPASRAMKAAVNGVLGCTGLGDTLFAWARR